MRCKICGSKACIVDYKGKIRIGSTAKQCTKEDAEIWHCQTCGLRWHDYQLPEDYYEGNDYWTQILGAGGGGDSYVQKSYERYGDRILECMNYIGTECIYGKRVLDFGCAEGMLLDAVKGIAGETIGVELNREMLGSLRKRGHYAYETLEECLEQEAGSVDAAVSFDVIEHVMDPQKVLRQLYELLDEGGRIIMGTPTDSPVLRELAGKNFEEFLFHMGHLWTFSEDSLRMCFERAGFKEIEIKNIYKYSLGNVFGWLQKKRPVGNKKYDFVTDTLNEVWKHEMERQGKGDYLVAYARK